MTVTDRGEIVAELVPPRRPEAVHPGLEEMARRGDIRLGKPLSPEQRKRLYRIMPPVGGVPQLSYSIGFAANGDRSQPGPGTLRRIECCAVLVVWESRRRGSFAGLSKVHRSFHVRTDARRVRPCRTPRGALGDISSARANELRARMGESAESWNVIRLAPKSLRARASRFQRAHSGARRVPCGLRVTRPRLRSRRRDPQH